MIKDLNAQQAREALGEKQKALGKVFEEALVPGDSGRKQYDFNKVTCLGADVKGSIAVAEKVATLNAEANELAQHAETLEVAEKAVTQWDGREKAFRRVPLPGGGNDGERGGAQIKSLGQRVIEEKSYQAWAKAGAAGGVNFSYEDAWASDVLAKGASFDTMATKTLMARTAGYAPEVIRAPGFVEAATRPIQVLDIIPMFQTDQSSYKYMEETTRTHNAAEKAEGATFAESAFGFTERSAPVQKITDSLPVTDEQLQDVPSMNGYIDSRLTFGIRQRLDGQCIVGDGSDPNLRGLKNVSGIQTRAVGADPVMDAYFKAMTNVRLVGRATPTHHLMHPLDWQNIRLTRTADGIYIFGSPTDAGPERLWGLPVVQQDADVQGRGYTGSFLPMFCSLFERQGDDVDINAGRIADGTARVEEVGAEILDMIIAVASGKRIRTVLFGAVALGVNNAILADTAMASGATTVVTTGFTAPDVARCVTVKGNDANVTGNVVVEGKNFEGVTITETIALAGAAVVSGNKAFKTVTKVTLPAYAVANTERVRVGTGAKLGLPVRLTRNTVLFAFLAGVREATAPTVAVSGTAIESNTMTLNSALAGTAVIADLYETT